MKSLLYNYYIDYSQKDKTRLILLCLLHELRVISIQQLIEFFQIEKISAESTVYKHLGLLRKEGLIARSKNGMNTYYYLTKEGHNYIGGYYTLPKVPEYNLQHHLQINDYLIKMLKLCHDHLHLKAVVSERRKVFEVKDQKKNKKGVKYFVPDFIFMFLDRIGREVEWQFEIELTLKTKNRYSEGVFPKYIKHLKNYEDARLIYVTPSPIIKEELDTFKEYFIYKEGDEYKEVFERLHVFSAEEFEPSMKKLIEEDPFINW
ncbi:helix-turn-helix domain-containing protein (plasmid) [Enterococcus faecalis]|uniref:helix-turn-helix domain-containing protein n=1 Tax=Enterococcus faecalis TaxID=1351 RepID=UPI0029C7D493|nr:helix-turn-helix domain-containing protein [Enterococcus faecalis]WPH48393.1 helix-turn-helix domain-containing protein [Enterococcus faecalis]